VQIKSSKASCKILSIDVNVVKKVDQQLWDDQHIFGFPENVAQRFI
jgi:hypothetical protein